MSILANKDTHVVIQGGAAGVNAARRMAEFCYLIKRPLNVEAFVYPPDAGKTNEIPYGSGLIAIPIYKTIAEATKNHPTDQHQSRLYRCGSRDEGRDGSAGRFAYQGGLDDHRGRAGKGCEDSGRAMPQARQGVQRALVDRHHLSRRLPFRA